jgi:dihydroflavonol-4-reductase
VPSDPVLVTGGTGLLGRALVEHLVAEGRAVRALARSEEAERALAAAGAEPVRGDVLDPSSLSAAMAGCASAFHVAGVNAMCLRDPRPMYRANVDGAANVVRAAAGAGLGRLVHTSSASAIGEAHGTVGREDSPHRGSYLSQYERSKELGERTVLALAAELGLDVVCVNPSSVQGPGRTGGSARLLLDLVNGRLPALIDTTISLVDIDDCTRGHVLAEARGAPGERYLLNGATLTTREAVAILQRIWGRPERVRWIPASLARLGGAGVEGIGRLLRREVPICREAVRTLLHGHRYDGSRAARELGLRYTPLETSLRRTLSWYAERGLVPQRARPGDDPRT